MKIPQPFGSRVSRYVCKILVIKIAQIHKFGLVARLWNLRGSRQITTVFISIGLNSENTHSSLRRSRNLDPSKVSNVRASRQLQLRQENLRWCHRARLSAIKVTQSPPVGANLEFRPIVMKTAVTYKRSTPVKGYVDSHCHSDPWAQRRELFRFLRMFQLDYMVSTL